MEPSFHSQGPSLAGTVLRASHQLTDPNFYQTLVYMAQHDAEGTLGFIMNRPLGTSLGRIAKNPDVPPPLADLPVFFGGPVRPESVLVAVFSRSEDGRLTCRYDLPLEQVEAHAQSPRDWIRIFTGYAGWNEGQLEQEIAGEAWTIADPDESLFNVKLLSGLWRVYGVGDDRWRTLIAHLPDHPEHN